MKRPIIGIPGWKTGENSFGCGINHLNFISKFGEPHIIMPWDHNPNAVDMLYLPGGMDLNPAAYNQYPGFYTGNQDVHKQYFFDKKLPLFIEAKKPIFGVCLGFQMLGVAFGSRLEQDLPYHEQSPDRYQKGHKVGSIAANCMAALPGFEIEKTFDVNSHHHQGFLSLSSDLLPLAVSTDKVIEAFMHKKLPIMGVQWHPEEWFDNFSSAAMLQLLSKVPNAANAAVTEG